VTARVVTFGEMLLRLSPGGGQRLLTSPSMRGDFGGAEANVAVALGHLGVACDYVTRLPANLIGDAASETLQVEGVGVGRVLRGPERMGLYFVEPGGDVGANRVVYDRANSAFAAIMPEMIDWTAILTGAMWFHVTGITAALGQGPLDTLAAGIDAAQALGVPVSFDLNYRPALWQGRDGTAIVKRLVCGVDLLIANPHSARALLGIDEGVDALATTAGAARFGGRLAASFACRRIALTRREVTGPMGNRWSAALFDANNGEIVSSHCWDVSVIDRIGSGDSFAASLIASLLRDDALPVALEFAVAASALKLRCAGDFNRASSSEVGHLLADRCGAEQAATALAR
jgi:2-dehydro-3-deoxygluconokinase